MKYSNYTGGLYDARIQHQSLMKIINEYNIHCQITDFDKLYFSEDELLVLVSGYEHDDGAQDNFKELQYYRKQGNNGFSRMSVTCASEKCAEALRKFVEKSNTKRTFEQDIEL